MGIFKDFQSELIDLSYLLEASEEDDDFIKMMLDSFLANTPTYIQDLHLLLSEKNYRELYSCAHKFKGTVVIIGVDSLRYLLESFELASEAQKDNMLADLLQKIETLSKKVIKELNIFFTNKK